jgi:hypothetical protein
MPARRALRAKQSTTTAGTGTLTLLPASGNARSFRDAYGSSPVYGKWVVAGVSAFEVFYGTFDGGSPGTLTRDTVVFSSNAGSLVALSGTCDVFPWDSLSDREVAVMSATSITLTVPDLGTTLVWTGSAAGTVNLPAAAAVPDGCGFEVLNRGTARLVLDPNGAETINGSATFALLPGDAVQLYEAGGAWVANRPRPDRVISATASTSVTLAAGDAGQMLNWTGSTAGTVNLPAAATVREGAGYEIRNAGSARLTLDADASETIDGPLTVTLLPGDILGVIRSGSGWIADRTLPAEVLLSTTAGTGVSQLDVVLAGGWRRYRFGLILATSVDAALWLRVRPTGGAVLGGSTDYKAGSTFVTGASAGAFASADTGNIVLLAGVDGGTAVYGTGEFWRGDSNSPFALDRFTGHAPDIAGSGTLLGGTVIGRRAANGEVDLVRIMPSTGTITGSIALWGIRD